MTHNMRINLYLILVFIWIYHLGACYRTKDTIPNQSVQRIGEKKILERAVFFDSIILKIVREEYVEKNLVIWRVQRNVNKSDIWHLDITDTLGRVLPFQDSVFDCNGDNILDLVIGTPSMSGSFGGASYSVYAYSKKNNKVEAVHSFSDKYNVVFFPERKEITTFDFNYTFEMVKYYEWIGEDSLLLFKIDSIADPFLTKGIDFPKTRYITTFKNGIKYTTKKNGNFQVSKKYKDFIGSKCE